jgi:hypothetical protein
MGYKKYSMGWGGLVGGDDEKYVQYNFFIEN